MSDKESEFANPAGLPSYFNFPQDTKFTGEPVIIRIEPDAEGTLVKPSSVHVFIRYRDSGYEGHTITSVFETFEAAATYPFVFPNDTYYQNTKLDYSDFIVEVVNGVPGKTWQHTHSNDRRPAGFYEFGDY